MMDEYRKRTLSFIARQLISRLRELDPSELAEFKRALRDYDIKRRQWREPHDPIAASMPHVPLSDDAKVDRVVIYRDAADKGEGISTPLGDLFTAIDLGLGAKAVLRCNRCGDQIPPEFGALHRCVGNTLS